MNRTNQVVLLVTAGVVSLCAGALLSSNFKNAGQTITLATLLSLPTVAGLHLVLDGKATKRINEAQNKASKAESKASEAELKAVEATTTLNQAQFKLTELGKKNSELANELASVRKVLEDVNLHRDQLLVYAEKVQPTISQLQQELISAQETVEGLQVEIESLEEDFEEKVETEVQQRFQEAKREEIQRIFDEHDQITGKAMELFKRLQSWGQKVAVSHEQKRELITSLANAYNQNLDELGVSVENERGHYLEQIELLREKVGRLQHQLAGDLVEPEYGQFGYAVEGKIANDLARRVWEDLQVPLSVKGYQVKSDGSVDIGYGFSRSIPVEALVSDLQRHSEHLVKWLGIHKITGIRKLEIADLVVLTFRREPAVKEDEIKRLFTPIDKLAIQVIREMSRKGTVRIMGATGDGKGVCARYLVSRLIQLEEWYIRLHDPQDGSAQDYWGIPKVSKSGKELKQALKNISAQMLERESSKVHTPVTLDILDEIDTQLEKDDKGQFLNLISRVRHLGMKMILIGQNPKVSRAGFQWADMEQMIAFYQGSSALDAIKNNPSLELKKDILLRQYEEISSVLQAKNEWLDDAKKHYFGLCVIPGKSPQWYELPIADEIEVDISSTLLCESFAFTNSNSNFKDSKTSGKTFSNLANTNTNSSGYGEAETFTQKELATIPATSDYVDATATTAKLATGGKATCKKHPESELRLYKDGRGYCTSCKKKLAKSDIEYGDNYGKRKES